MGKRRHREEEEDHSTSLILLTQPVFVRFSHWLVVFLLTLAIFSGLYMTEPVLPGLEFRWIRLIHLTANALLTPLVLSRVYYAWISGDYRNFIFHRGDFRRFLHLMSYYFFLTKNKPYEATKYNVGQRLIYDSWLVGWFIQSFTGIILMNPGHPTFVLLSTLFGGLQTIRMLRYLIAVYFVVTIIIHIYLSVTSDPAKFQAIFTGYVRVKDGKPEQ